MLYSTASATKPELFILDIIFTEPIFMALVLLIPAGLYLLKKDIFQAKLIGCASLAAGCLYAVTRIIYFIK